MEFKNINDLYSYIEFCPLCNKRMIYTEGYISNRQWKPKVNSREFILLDELNENLLSINLNTNIVKSDYKDFLLDFSKLDDIILKLGRECRRYHFYYDAFVYIDAAKWQVKFLELRKARLIRILDKTHFAVNNDFITNSTEIKITNDFNTKDIKLKLNGFNITKVKNIDAKLNAILLLT